MIPLWVAYSKSARSLARSSISFCMRKTRSSTRIMMNGTAKKLTMLQKAAQTTATQADW